VYKRQHIESLKHFYCPRLGVQYPQTYSTLGVSVHSGAGVCSWDEYRVLRVTGVVIIGMTGSTTFQGPAMVFAVNAPCGSLFCIVTDIGNKLIYTSVQHLFG